MSDLRDQAEGEAAARANQEIDDKQAVALVVCVRWERRPAVKLDLKAVGIDGCVVNKSSFDAIDIELAAREGMFGAIETSLFRKLIQQLPKTRALSRRAGRDDILEIRCMHDEDIDRRRCLSP
jgi:hypothetical protein